MNIWHWLMEVQPFQAPRWINACFGFMVWAICNRIVRLEAAVKALQAGKKGGASCTD